jgi:hypothetical protein
MKKSNMATYQYLEDFLVSKAKKLNYHNFEDPEYDPRPISYKLAQQADENLKKNRKLIIENSQETVPSKEPNEHPQREKSAKKDRRSIMHSANHGQLAKTPQKSSKREVGESSTGLAAGQEALSLSSLVAKGLKERENERRQLPEEEVQRYLAELESEEREKQERYRLEDEAERLEAEAAERRKQEKFEQAKKEVEAKERKRLDQEKILKMKAKALEEEKEKLKRSEKKQLDDALKPLSGLKFPEIEEYSKNLEASESLGSKEEPLEQPPVDQPLQISKDEPVKSEEEKIGAAIDEVANPHPKTILSIADDQDAEQPKESTSIIEDSKKTEGKPPVEPTQDLKLTHRASVMQPRHSIQATPLKAADGHEPQSEPVKDRSSIAQSVDTGTVKHPDKTASQEEKVLEIFDNQIDNSVQLPKLEADEDEKPKSKPLSEDSFLGEDPKNHPMTTIIESVALKEEANEKQETPVDIQKPRDSVDKAPIPAQETIQPEPDKSPVIDPPTEDKTGHERPLEEQPNGLPQVIELAAPDILAILGNSRKIREEETPPG